MKNHAFVRLEVCHSTLQKKCMHSKRTRSLKAIARQIQTIIFALDVIYLNGDSLHRLPMIGRSLHIDRIFWFMRNGREEVLLCSSSLRKSVRLHK